MGEKSHKILSVFINAVFVLLRNVSNVSYTITYGTSLRIDIFDMRGTLIMLFILNIQKYVSRPFQRITNYVTFAVSEYILDWCLVRWKSPELPTE